MIRSRFGLMIASACAALVVAAGPASAWQYGDSWIITNYTLQGDGWNSVASGGYNDAAYHWAAGSDGVRRAYWYFDNSVHGGDAPTGPELFLIYRWVPSANSTQWLPVQVNFNGGQDDPWPINPNIPWAGQFGTNAQWMGINQQNQGAWVQGSATQVPVANFDGMGAAVWATAGSSFYTKYDFGWNSNPHSISALKIVVVPEPGTMVALGAGLVSMAGMVIRRRK